MDKKTIAIVVVLGLLVVFWFPIIEKLGLYTPAPPKPAETTEQVSPQTTPDSTTPNTAAPIQASQPATQQLPIASADSTVQMIATPVDTTTPMKADTVVVTTDKYTVTLTSAGGGPIGLQLNEQLYRDGTPIQMISNPSEVTPDIRFAGNSFATSNLSYECSAKPGHYDATKEPVTISYTFRNDKGKALIKKYTFHPKKYDYQFTVSVEEPATFGFERKYNVNWNTPLQPTEPQLKHDYDLMQAVAMMGGSRSHLDDFSGSTLNQSLEGNTTWAGLRSMYYAAVIIPEGRLGSGVSAQGTKEKMRKGDQEYEERKLTVALEMEFGSLQGITDSFTVFVGPMDYFLMSDYHVDLEAILDIGTTPFIGWIIKPFALAVMWLLPILHKFVPNYGIVIILFALIVKIITMPLSLKSMRSMNAMKELAPKMENLKKQYKNDPTQLNAAMMKLYKEHGVNPLSGCLPMLLQMPLFFAMFSVFRSTILLRDAPFVWFITDLSKGANSFTDPYIILVVLMVGAQFVSQWLTMSRGASTQQNKMMMYLMPPLMGFLFHTFSAGLVLYWTSFSIMSVLDYYVAMRGKPKNEHVQTA